MDLVVECQRLPRPGETIHGDSICELPGGKGANQAVAAARLGAEVSLIARVGDDTFASRLLTNFEKEHVSINRIMQTKNCASGVAVVTVDALGENAITIIAGANDVLSPKDVHAAASEIEAADVLLLQLESPKETALAAIAVARSSGTLVLLDPAPAPTEVTAELLDVDYIFPNENEAATLTELKIETDAQVCIAAKRLSEMGARCVVITRGERGALVYERDGEPELVESVAVNAVDSTGAGDAFAAAFAVRVSQNATPRESARYACLAGAAATTRFGAQTALPTRSKIDAINPIRL